MGGYFFFLVFLPIMYPRLIVEITRLITATNPSIVSIESPPLQQISNQTSQDISMDFYVNGATNSPKKTNRHLRQMRGNTQGYCNSSEMRK